ncbi:MAG: CSLREA domain-containing protein, partial [Chloroflexaceae bacterium]|nr:CSLREA domain-containing protein [Chloroflexaceae bacterium]
MPITFLSRRRAHSYGLLMLFALVLALASGFVFWSHGYAAVITVNTTADELNTDGDCSLREAIATFNDDVAVDACPNDAADDTIIVPAGTFTLTA